jgi:hypothetical protein
VIPWTPPRPHHLPRVEPHPRCQLPRLG